MSRPVRADLGALVNALLASEVEFIIVGGAAAVLHGALAMTQDLDIVHRMTTENIHRLLDLLERLDAVVREPGTRRLKPNAAHLMSGGQLNLLTSLGPLDLLGRLHDGRDYEALLAHSELLSDQQRQLRVVDLPTLIAIKTAAGRAKDRIVLPLLLAALRTREETR